MKGNNNNGASEIYSSVVKAGKRTYFFDVKETRSNDLFISITESRRITDENGETFFEKQKVFVYTEDLKKFTDGLCDAINFVENLHCKKKSPCLTLIKKSRDCSENVIDHHASDAPDSEVEYLLSNEYQNADMS